MPLDPTGLLPGISAALQLANLGAGKLKDAADVNIHIDRAGQVASLFDPDADVRQKAYHTLYAEMQTLIAKKGLTPNLYYGGAPCINIPLATIIQLMDSANV